MEDFNTELAVAKKKTETISRTLQGPGVFWFLIVLMLIMSAFAVGTFGRARQEDGTAIISRTPIPTEDAREARIYTISYKGGVFSPTNLRIRAGDTVRFKNDGLFAVHIASNPEENLIVGFDSVGDVPPGSYFSFTFATKGIFGYYNQKNKDQTGTIIVR